jgi:tRNA A37 N6-isopentenylltransferase MiaA
MIQEGIVEEFQRMSAAYPQSRMLSAIGYAQVRNYLQGIQPPSRKLRAGLLGLQDEIELATRQLVKAQRTWFRKLLLQVPNAKRFELEREQLELKKELFAPCSFKTKVVPDLA